MRKEKNSNVVLYISFIIGCLLMIMGFSQILKVSSYTETIGQYTHSEKRISTDSDGHTSINYVWYYDFFVNDTKYIAKLSNSPFETPNNYEEKVFYNPENPDENVIGTDYSRYTLIIVGFIFASVPFFFGKSKQTVGSIGIRKPEKKTAWFVILFSGSLLMILLLQANFNIVTLIMNMFLPTLIILLFLGVGIYLLKRTDNSNSISTVTSSDNFSDITSKNDSINFNININNVSEASDLLDTINNSENIVSEEQAQKINKLVKKYLGIAEIIFGFVWCGIVLLPEIISAFLVLLSLSAENPTYTVNGENVTGLQFIFSSFSPFTCIFLGVGIILIIKGIKDIVVCKKIEKDEM